MTAGISRTGAWWLISAACALAGAPFVAPADGPVPFRRDRLPIDVEAMTTLSRQLSLMVKEAPLEQPAQRRLAAQALGLSLALDSANREARELISELEKSGGVEGGDAAEIQKARARVWQLLDWLEAPEAGPDAQALGACLSDVIAAIDPDHAGADQRREKGDRGAWTGWVPELASYERKASKPDPTDRPKGPSAAIVRKDAKVSTPLWVYDNNSQRLLQRNATISMKAWIEEDEEKRRNPFKFQLENTGNADALAKTGDTVVSALKAMGDSFPRGGHLSLNCGGGDYMPNRNHDSISAAAAVLADAAVSGREPAATVFGIVGADGKLKLPSQAWEKLRILSDGPGGRLILPREAEAMLPSVLAMEDAAFFMKYEVILAGNVTELTERAQKVGQGTLAEVSERFSEIRAKQGTMPLGQYVANHFIRQRLGEIIQAFPDHASARMLDMQGAGKRPTWLPRTILACELRRAMEPVGRLVRSNDVNNSNLEVDQIDRAIESSRTKVEALDRYSEMHDRDICTRCKDVITACRALAKARRGKEDYNNNGWSRWQTTYSTFKATSDALRHELDAVAGESDPLDTSQDPRQDNPPNGK